MHVTGHFGRTLFDGGVIVVTKDIFQLKALFAGQGQRDVSFHLCPAAGHSNTTSEGVGSFNNKLMHCPRSLR